MALAIPTDTPNWREIMEILTRWSEHSQFCDVCNVRTGAYCNVGGQILHELTQYPEVREAPENWVPPTTEK